MDAVDTRRDGSDDAETGRDTELDAGDSDTEMGPRYGLDQRPSNTTCLAPERPPSDSSIELERAFPNLTFNRPVWLTQAPGASSRWYLVEQPGRIVTFSDNSQTNATRTYIDLRNRVTGGGERGLLGMAFHPDWPQTREVYLSYTTNINGQLHSRISRFTPDPDGQGLDPASEEVLFTLEQPYGNHNGGQIAFGPDGYLYAGFGDGGSGGDPHRNGQDTNTILGTIIRIDVDRGNPYGIPPSNPFANGQGGKPEIYAWGLRNPWRFSFDMQTGELWAGDVGQNEWEEIDQIERGGNYGWSAKEGDHCFNTTPCKKGPWIDPVVEYRQRNGNRSVTGGYVYRGDDVPSLKGTYLYGDYVSGRIWGLFYDPKTGEPAPKELLDTSHRISSFAQRKNGEMYVLDYQQGEIWRITPSKNGSTNNFPKRLTETGCVDPNDPTTPADGLIPYRVNAPFWSDGASKERYIALPPGESIERGNREDGWTFPKRTVIVKHFRLDGRYVETRLMVRHRDGAWAGYSYDWNRQQTDARLVEGGGTEQVAGQEWMFPSRSDCLTCHTAAAGRTLGLKTAQLNGDLTYPSTGRTANQLETLDHVGAFDQQLSERPSNLPRMPDPFGGAPRGERVEAYLHTNCAQCHRSGAAMRTDLDLHYETPWGQRGVCNAEPVGSDLGIDGARLLVPGSPSKSLVHARANRRDARGMPPLASNRVDTRGMNLLARWIQQLRRCP